MSSSHNFTNSSGRMNGEEDFLYDDENRIQILVCSGNLGNAQPDEASWNHWVPLDGYCSEVIRPHSEQRYPFRRMDAMLYKKLNRNNGDEEDCSEHASREDQFDIIVFGMQESTFDQVKEDNNSDDGMNESNRSLGVIKALSSTTGKTVKTITKHSGKTLSALQTLSTSRDYIAKVQSSPHKRTAIVDPLAGDLYSPVAETPRLPDKEIPMTTTGSQLWHGGTQVLHALMAERLPSYERVVSFQRGEMRLEILAHTGRTTVEVVHVSAQNTGRAGLANKGGIVAELLVNGRTRLSFLTAHLEAHEGASKYQTRVSTMADILAGTKQQQHDCSQTAHYSFVMGDLNFRTELPNHAELDEEEHKGIVGDFVERKDWDSLNKIDELQRALKNKDCLVGYRTLFCNFPPTFKLERQSGYKYNDKRRPSYTDRILWKTNEGLENALYPLVYEPIDEFTSSDHKPVRAAFAVDLVHPFLLRPRLARRRSALNVSRILSKKKSKLLDVSRNERLHLFLTDISCEIFTKGKGTRASDRSVMMPNPYISLVSDPPEALQQPVKQGWKKVRQDVWKSIAVWSNPRPSAKNLTSKGFPRSSTKKQTVSTKWDKEEIHTEVTTHYNDGSPIDLSGALLQITVMDSRNPAFDTLIGSTATNLANLIQSCQSPIATNKLRKKRLRSTRSRPNRRMSLMQVFGRRSGADRSSIRDVDDLEEEHIRSIEIDEALVKNGVETGRIKLKLETMWMDETTRKAFNGLQSSSAFFPSQRMTANASSDTADQECGQRRGGHVLR